MRRPPNLMKTMAAPEPAQRPADPSPPTNYLDLYGLSKPPFGGAAESGGFILFASQRRGFELLVDHMVNAGGPILLLGEEGIGKTETLRAAAGVAAESDIKAIIVSRPAGDRISLRQLVAALDGKPENFHAPPRKALLADDIDLMPNDCINLLLSLAKATPEGPRSSSIVLTASAAALMRPEVSELIALARNTIRMPRLGPAEVRQYIERSLWIAGGTTRRLISADALKFLIARSGGVPATINRLMEAVFTAGFARGDSTITAKTVSAAMGPVAPRPRQQRTAEPSGVPARAMQIAAIGLLVTGASVFLYKGLSQSPPPAPVAAQSRPANTARPPPVNPANAMPPDLMAALMKRGNESLKLGDIAAARLLFLRAADAGNAAAATALGKTYDPTYAADPAAHDPQRAARWYQKAITLGDPAAIDLLKRLETG